MKHLQDIYGYWDTEADSRAMKATYIYQSYQRKIYNVNEKNPIINFDSCMLCLWKQ